MSSTPLNPLPQGPAIVDKNGVPTQELYWFLLTLFTTVQSNSSATNIPFVPVVPAPGSDPFVQSLLKQAAFTPGAAASLAAAVQARFAAISKQLSFAQQTNNALDRINALERALAFRPQPPQAPSGVQLVVYTQAQYRVAYVAGLGGLPLFIYVSDYAHLIYWDGSTAVFADGGNNFISAFENDPIGPGWHLMDGATVDYLNTDGTFTAQVLEDLTSDAAHAAYPKWGSPNSGPNAAVAPTISGQTEDQAVGFTGSPAAAGTASINSAAVGTPTNVLVPPISGGGGALTTDPHHHTLLVANAPISATGEPQNLERRPFFRQ